LVEVTVTFEDSYGQNLQENLSLNFADLVKEGRELVGQESDQAEISRGLKEIQSELNGIKDELNGIKGRTTL